MLHADSVETEPSPAKPTRSGISRALVAFGLAASLVGCGGSSASQGTTTPAAAASDDGFDAKKAKIEEVVPSWDHGSGIAIRFLKEATGGRTSLIFADTNAPAYNAELSMWLIQGLALGSDDEVIGHAVIGLSDLAPGTYEGNPEQKEAVLAVLITEGKFDGHSPDACWSLNPNSFVRVALRDRGDGNLVGDFQGKLVSNDSDNYLTIESGFLLINR